MASWQIVLTSVVVSSIITAVLNAFFVFFQKNMEYKREFYKVIIDRRIKAYETVEKLLGNFSTYRSTASENHQDKSYECFLPDEENTDPLQLIFTDFDNIYKAQPWISRDLMKEIHQFNGFMIKVYGEISKSEYIEYEKLGILHYNEIRNIVSRIRSILGKDWLKLHRIGKKSYVP